MGVRMSPLQHLPELRGLSGLVGAMLREGLRRVPDEAAAPHPGALVSMRGGGRAARGGFVQVCGVCAVQVDAAHVGTAVLNRRIAKCRIAEPPQAAVKTIVPVTAHSFTQCEMV